MAKLEQLWPRDRGTLMVPPSSRETALGVGLLVAGPFINVRMVPTCPLPAGPVGRDQAVLVPLYGNEVFLQWVHL